MDHRLNTSLDAALTDARECYLASRPNTVAAHEAAARVMPGGNTRTVLYHGPVPLRITGGDGACLTDADGHRYLNLLGEYTAGIYGHNNPVIRRAIDKALDGGVNLSGHNTYEARLAQLVCERFRSIELVRFTNSGTEANLMTIATARVFTGRNKVMVMDGGYHGGLLYFGGGGIPINAPYDFVLGTFNDVEATRTLIAEHGPELACIHVEPMLGSGGCIPAEPGFLEMLREEATRVGALLTFDEVMTSRFAGGGAQGLCGVTPDMTALGKYIGGGMTAGAFGGRADIMAMYDPTREGAMPHAGTFNNNVVTMAAGIAGLGEVFTLDAARQLHVRGDALRLSLNDLFARHDAAMHASGVGSLIGLHGIAERFSTPSPKPPEANDRLDLVFLDLLEAGYYVAQRGFIALSLPVTDEEVQGFLAALDEILASRHSVLA